MGEAIWRQQVSIYLGKCIRIFRNEKAWKSFISAGLIALLISAVVSDNIFLNAKATQQGSFAIMCGCIWIGIFNSIQSVCRERDILKREHREGLKMTAYIAAHMIYEAMLSMAEGLIVVLVTWLMHFSNMPAMGVMMPAVIEFYITFLLLIYSSDMLGLMVSSAVKTPNTAMTVMPFLLIIELVLGGFLFKLEGAMKTVSYFTVSKWGLQAFCTSADITGLEEGLLVENSADYAFKAGNVLRPWGILLAFALIYAAVAALALENIDRDQR